MTRSSTKNSIKVDDALACYESICPLGNRGPGNDLPS